MALMGIGWIAGTLSGLLGIGGGVILVPALTLILKLEVHEAIGISLATIAPTALSGAIKHYQSGNVDLKFALLVIVGAVVGGYGGAMLAQRLSGLVLRKAFAVLMLVVAGKMLLS